MTKQGTNVLEVLPTVDIYRRQTVHCPDEPDLDTDAASQPNDTFIKAKTSEGIGDERGDPQLPHDTPWPLAILLHAAPDAQLSKTDWLIKTNLKR